MLKVVVQHTSTDFCTSLKPLEIIAISNYVDISVSVFNQGINISLIY